MFEMIALKHVFVHNMLLPCTHVIDGVVWGVGAAAMGVDSGYRSVFLPAAGAVL
jgi:hypothetical protein